MEGYTLKLNIIISNTNQFSQKHLSLKVHHNVFASRCQ